MNLAVHGLEGDIKKAISYYEDLHESVAKFDFVLANPPFNVNAVDKDRLAKETGPGHRYPFGLPKTDNANYLWIQLFYSSLNENGRAAFVMANSASDARSSELEIRRKLIEARAVDAIVAVGPNMFYTVTLPCTLWFLDKRKSTPHSAPSTQHSRRDSVLFVDARHIFRQIDRAHRDWTDPQISFLANVVRLYRREELDFTLGGKEAEAKLAEHFPKLQYRDMPGLCRKATVQDIEKQGWSLNPGRYVGVIPSEKVSGEDFKVRLQALNEQLASLNADARALEETIAQNVASLIEMP
jgi:type I restriction enzyme M protein